MEILENLNQSPLNEEKAEKIKKLIENGEAFDQADAVLALIQEADALFYRNADKQAALEQIEESLERLDAEAGALFRHWQELKEADEDPEEIRRTAGELSDCDLDRLDLRFASALIFAADNPGEREYLYYNSQLDQLAELSDEAADQPANALARQRLENKARPLAEAIGAERTAEIFAKYRARLQELVKGNL